MDIAGWKTTSVFHRYAIVDEAQIEDALRKIAQFSGSGGNKPDGGEKDGSEFLA